MSFPPGKPLLLILAFAFAGGVGMLLLPQTQASSQQQVIWVFDPLHAQTYREPAGAGSDLLASYAQVSGQTVQVELIPSRVVDARLQSLILSHARGPQVPDLVEIEIGSIGKFFRASPQHNGLYPLDEFLRNDPAAGDLLPSRLATWSSGGHVFGIPLDVHPVSITYRRDLFAQAGVDLAACTTWSQFRTACLAYKGYWAARGQPRTPMQLARWSASDLMILLYQQRVTLFDAAGNPQLTDPRLPRTIAFYARLVAGPEAISDQVSTNHFVDDLADGHTAALFTPDWRVGYLRYHPKLLGNLAMMPLPRFSPGDAPTASWGGTMIAIPRNCSDPARSWQLLRHLELSSSAVQARQNHSNILPALQSVWANPTWRQPDPIFAGQPIGALYIDLARQLPQQASSPYLTFVTQALAAVLASAESRISDSQENLEAHCASELAVAQQALDRLIRFGEGMQ